MQIVWKQDAHVRKPDSKKLDTYANSMKSQSFDSKKISGTVYQQMLINANLRTGESS
jgi:hypothetical protein